MMKQLTRSSAALMAATAILLMILAVSAQGQQAIDESRQADAKASISIDNLSGSVSLTGWDREEVKVTGTLGKGSERLEFSGDADRIRIEVVLPRRARHIDPSHLEIYVPRAARVQVGTVNADVSAAEITGRLGVDTVNGDVDVAGEVEELDVETVSGDVDLRVQCQDSEVSSVSGEIRLTGLRGQAAVETVSGDVTLTADVLTRFRFSTVSGDLEFTGEPSEDGRYSFASQSGDIHLELPEKMDAEFEISTFSGDIDNAFGPAPKKKSKYVPAQELYFVLGDGSASFEIETFSGDIEIDHR